MRYFPPKGTAGLATLLVRAYRRAPCPPASSMATISFFILKNHLSHILCRNGGQALSGRSSVFCQFLLGSGALALCGAHQLFSCVPDSYGCTDRITPLNGGRSTCNDWSKLVAGDRFGLEGIVIAPALPAEVLVVGVQHSLDRCPPWERRCSSPFGQWGRSCTRNEQRVLLAILAQVDQ